MPARCLFKCALYEIKSSKKHIRLIFFHSFIFSGGGNFYIILYILCKYISSHQKLNNVEKQWNICRRCKYSPYDGNFAHHLTSLGEHSKKREITEITE